MQKCRRSSRSSRSSRFSGNLELFGDSERKHEKEHISNGNGFIEDTSFYHKGSNPKNNHSRGILQIVYGIKNWDDLS
jgi:hypothetical protein